MGASEMMQEERRTKPRMPVREEIMQAISQENDPKDRSMLLFMLDVLDRVELIVKEAMERVEKLVSDEKALQLKVLNGLSENHHQEHAEFRQHLEESKDYKDALEWLKQHKLDEEERAEKSKSLWMKLLGGLVSQFGAIIVTAVATIMGMQWLVK